MRVLFFVAIFSVVASAQGAGPTLSDFVYDETTCGSLENRYGPFDYRTATHAQQHIVESYHFDEGVATLKRGMTGPIGSDIAYTLRAFPNHPRALQSLIWLQDKERTTRPFGMEHPVACWFERATRFTPDDLVVRLLFGIYLLRNGQSDLAIKEIERTIADGSSDSNAYYNLGLAYFQKKNYERARENAKRAYALGFPLPGLRDLLKKAGKWVD